MAAAASLCFVFHRWAEIEAWEWLRQHADREYSFVDATSFAVMRRRRLSDALTFDNDFTSAGFVEGRPG